MDAMAILESRIRDLMAYRGQPLVAIDGRSAAGKSTLAHQAARAIGAIVIDGDDFYSGGTSAAWDAMSPAEKADHCIDWRRQRPVLEALAAGGSSSWHAYDWESDDGRLVETATECLPAAVVILDGAYSARPELGDLFHLRVLLEADSEARRLRLIQREGVHSRDEWNARWDEAEQWYFTHLMPAHAFDLVIDGT